MNSYSDQSEQEAQDQGRRQMNHDGYMSEMVNRILFSNFFCYENNFDLILYF